MFYFSVRTVFLMYTYKYKFVCDEINFILNLNSARVFHAIKLQFLYVHPCSFVVCREKLRFAKKTLHKTEQCNENLMQKHSSSINPFSLISFFYQITVKQN